MLLDANSACSFDPHCLPVAKMLNLDLIHLGIMLPSILLRMYKPAFWINLFVASSILKKRRQRFMQA
jgi:TRAP-type C4-dicarboxylate transport system permease large subunit